MTQRILATTGLFLLLAGCASEPEHFHSDNAQAQLILLGKAPPTNLWNGVQLSKYEVHSADGSSFQTKLSAYLYAEVEGTSWQLFRCDVDVVGPNNEVAGECVFYNTGLGYGSEEFGYNVCPLELNLVRGTFTEAGDSLTLNLSGQASLFNGNRDWCTHHPLHEIVQDASIQFSGTNITR